MENSQGTPNFPLLWRQCSSVPLTGPLCSQCWECGRLHVERIHCFVLSAHFFLDGETMDGWKDGGMEATPFHPPCIYLPVGSRGTGREVYFQPGPPACGRLLDETRPRCASLSVLTLGSLRQAPPPEELPQRTTGKLWCRRPQVKPGASR